MQTTTDAQHIERLTYEAAKRRGLPVVPRPDLEQPVRSDADDQYRLDEAQKRLDAARQRRAAKIAANGKKSMEA